MFSTHLSKPETCINVDSALDVTPHGLSRVYGPNVARLRQDLWLELSDIYGYVNVQWLLGGDFNAIRRLDEKQGGCRINKSMRDFSEFISRFDLIDLPLNGAKYTGSNGHDSPTMSRVDRFLLSPDFDAKYPFALQLAQPSPASDHIPILLDPNDTSWGLPRFRFEPMFFEEEFGRLDNKIQQALTQISELDKIKEDSDLSSDQIASKANHKIEFAKLTKMGDIRLISNQGFDCSRPMTATPRSSTRLHRQGVEAITYINFSLANLSPLIGMPSPNTLSLSIRIYSLTPSLSVPHLTVFHSLVSNHRKSPYLRTESWSQRFWRSSTV
ncbi:hypothetical protein BVC80_39g3 [Macleaya cordata]|uniref:Endonuclease/exonuclease/phosphatase n=1 Tax=Macleaya cordata TaxID=56857 RepID=A0A200QAK4_MACCD|nr:hypothetical protein BVC80_39g3 [Macleaya cordata]